MAGCGGDSNATPEPEDARADVAAAFYPLAFAAAEIGGERVAMRNVTPPGVEPHDVELSARDVERIRAADVVFYLGGGFQPAVERAADGADGEAVDLLHGLDLLEGDAHVWLDPVRYAKVARRVGRVLGRPDRARAFEARLTKLHGELDRGLRDCDRRVIVTSHAAYGYLAERYGLEQIAITGLEPEAEPSARDLERAVDAIRRTGATTVFSETLLSSAAAEAVAREAGVRLAVLNPLEGLTEDEAERGEDYFSLMRDNLAALRTALGCR